MIGLMGTLFVKGSSLDKTYEEKQAETYRQQLEKLEENLRLTLRIYGYEAKSVMFTKTPPLENILIQIGKKLSPEEIKIIPTGG